MWKTLLKAMMCRRNSYRAELPPSKEGGSLARSSSFRRDQGSGSKKQICWSGKPGCLRTLIQTWEDRQPGHHFTVSENWEQLESSEISGQCAIKASPTSEEAEKKKTYILTSKYRAAEEEISLALGYGVYCREVETTWISQGLPPSCNVGWKKLFSVYHLTVCHDHFSCNSAIFQEERWQVLWDWGWIQGGDVFKMPSPVKVWISS